MSNAWEYRVKLPPVLNLNRSPILRAQPPGINGTAIARSSGFAAHEKPQ
jgi:hypothetical protein